MVLSDDSNDRSVNYGRSSCQSDAASSESCAEAGPNGKPRSNDIGEQLYQPDAPGDINPFNPLRVLLENRRVSITTEHGEEHVNDQDNKPAADDLASNRDEVEMNPLQILLMKRVEVVPQDPPDSRRRRSMEVTGEEFPSVHGNNDGENDLQSPLIDKRDGQFANKRDPNDKIPREKYTDDETGMSSSVRQRRPIQPDSSEDAMYRHMDPPQDNDVEPGRHDSQTIPLMPETASSTTRIFQSSLFKGHANSAKTTPFKLFTWFRSTFISAERLTALIILLGIASLFIDPAYLQSVQLDDKHLSYEQLSYRLSKAQERLNKTLDQEFGKYADLLWRGHGFTSNSIHRLRRRMMFKIFFLGKMREQERDVAVNFTWVTAGDGAAAGYGNLFHQAYTQIIENTVKDSFDAVGLHFVANNYAMDGMNSGPELALCMESIYGFDIDVLNYDFHETDKDADELYQLWANRAGIHPTMPTLFVNRVEPARAKINSQLEGVGLSTLGFNAHSIRSLLLDIPPDDLPYALDHYICDHTDDSQCESFKWDMEGTSCDLSEFQTKSRDGWKDHLIVGRAIGVFLIQQLRLALDELNEDSFESSKIHNITYSQEVDRKSFLSSSLHEVHEGNHVSKNTDFLGGLARFSPFWKTNAYCRTALLPNQARFDGLSTMGSQGQRHAGGFYTGYEIGHSINHLPIPPNGQSELMLVYNPESRHNCSSTYHIDYKDFFGIRSSDGWVISMVPNEMENDAFKDHTKRSAHVIILCDSIDTPISLASVASNDVYITINGVIVEQVHNLKLYGGESNCYLLYGKHTFLWPNKERQFKLGIKVNVQGKDGAHEMMRLSSIIII